MELMIFLIAVVAIVIGMAMRGARARKAAPPAAGAPTQPGGDPGPEQRK